MTSHNIQHQPEVGELHPLSAQGLLSTGLTSVMAGNLDEGIRYIERALAMDSSLAPISYLSDVYHARGKKYLEEGSPDLAIADFDRALDLDQLSHETYLLRGRAYQEAGNPQMALADFKRSLGMHPLRDETFARLAGAYSQLGDHVQARCILLDVLSWNPALSKVSWVKDLIEAEIPGYVGAEPPNVDELLLELEDERLGRQQTAPALVDVEIEHRSSAEPTKPEKTETAIPDLLKENGKLALKKIGDEVAAARGLSSQRRLADLVGTTEASIRRLERGETNTSIILFARTAKVLGLDVNELLAPIESEEALVNRQYEEHKAYIDERTSAMELNSETFSVKRELLRLLELWPR